MSGVFIDVINMSISAGCVALIVVLIRLLLKKAPKKYAYMLWAIVFFRFIVPFTIQLPASAVPIAPNPIPQNIAFSESPSIQSGVAVIDNSVNSAIDEALATENRAERLNPIQLVLEIGSVIWLIGIIALLLYVVIGYLHLQKRVKTSIRVKDNIYETDRIKTPFVFGVIHPKIYVPIGIDSLESQHVIMHEQTHIARRDYIIKPLAFLAVTIHWFNPLVWVAYLLMAQDMEQSADERVMNKSEYDIRGVYSSSLLSLTAKRSGLLSLLAFGEIGVKARIANILKYRKPALWISIVATVIVVTSSVLLAGSATGNNSIGESGAEPYSHAESDNTLVAYISEEYSENEAKALQEQISAIPNVDSVTFVGCQQAADEFNSSTGERPEGIDSSSFRDRYIISISDTSLIEQIISDLRVIQGVSKITTGSDATFLEPNKSELRAFPEIVKKTTARIDTGENYIIQENPQVNAELEVLYDLVSAYVSENKKENEIEVEFDKNTLLLRLASDVWFSSRDNELY